MGNEQFVVLAAEVVFGCAARSKMTADIAAARYETAPHFCDVRVDPGAQEEDRACPFPDCPRAYPDPELSENSEPALDKVAYFSHN